MTLLRRLILCLLMVMMVNGCASFNSYREAGTLPMTGLQQPVTVVRDEKGMPYVYAANLSDAFQAMGFVTAQDRLVSNGTDANGGRGTHIRAGRGKGAAAGPAHAHHRHPPSCRAARPVAAK